MLRFGVGDANARAGQDTARINFQIIFDPELTAPGEVTSVEIGPDSQGAAQLPGPSATCSVLFLSLCMVSSPSTGWSERMSTAQGTPGPPAATLSMWYMP